MEENYEKETSDLLSNSEINETSSLETPSYEISQEMKDYDQIFEEEIRASTSTDGQVEGENSTEKKSRKTYVRKSVPWNDSELKDLAVGLQNEGFSDLKKVSAYVKTKNEKNIREYLKKRHYEERKAENPNQRLGRSINERLAMMANVHKWQKLACKQMFPHVLNKEYSKPVVLALCKKFYEEEKEPDDPQVIDVKIIYKYLMDCMVGEMPSQLPPKESSLILDLLQEIRSMPVKQFEEEMKFLNDFKDATKFKPFEVKDEFKKRFKKSHGGAVGSNAVSVPEEVFMDLSRHKKLVQSFNPLVAPVWMLQKEQEVLEKEFQEPILSYDD